MPRNLWPRTYLREISDDRRKQIAAAARRRVLAEHTSERRASQLERYIAEASLLQGRETSPLNR